MGWMDGSRPRPLRQRQVWGAGVGAASAACSLERTCRVASMIRDVDGARRTSDSASSDLPCGVPWLWSVRVYGCLQSSGPSPARLPALHSFENRCGACTWRAGCAHNRGAVSNTACASGDAFWIIHDGNPLVSVVSRSSTTILLVKKPTHCHACMHADQDFRPSVSWK